MRSAIALGAVLIVAAAAAHGGEPSPKADSGDKLVSGMSIVGNDEAPKSLVIVPWKSSELGNTLDVSRSGDDGRQPVDPDVFMRELAYYRIRTGLADVASSNARPLAGGDQNEPVQED